MRWFALLAGFLLPWQTVWILRGGMLGGVPWPLATIGLYASDVVLLIAAAVGAMRRWRTDRRRLITALAVFIIAAAANVFVSADRALSAVGWLRLIAFLLALAGIPSWSASARRAFLGGFLVAIFGHVVLAFLQFATGHGFASTLLGTAVHDAFVRGDAVVETASGRWLRAYGGFPHPNILGTALLVAAAALGVIATKAQQQAVPENYDRRFLAPTLMPIVGVVLLIFALVLTFSRSALLGLIALLIVLARRMETRRFAIIGAATMVAAIAATWPLWTTRVTATGRHESRSLAERRTGIADALVFSMIPPFLGVGLHAMPQALVAFDRQRDPYAAQPAHDVPLLTVAEIGWLGIALSFLALTFLFPRGFSWQWEWFALLPPLLLDHHLWSLPVGLALVFALAVSVSLIPAPPFRRRVALG